MTSLSAEAYEFLSQPQPAVMATIDPHGRPMSVQIVYLVHDPHHLVLSIVTQASRGDRLNHLRRDPHVAITVLSREDWTKVVTVHGTAVEFTEDTDLQAIDAMSTRYFGAPYPIRAPRTRVMIRIDSWTAELAPTNTFHAADPH